MPTNVEVPNMGESVSEAILVRWLKEDGASVAKDENLAEFETDKANVEVASPAAGVLRQLKAPGAVLKIGDIFGRIEEAGATAVPLRQVEAAGPAPVQASAARPSPAPAVKPEDLSPAVRVLVEEKKVDVASITGTGRGGRVTKEDVVKRVAADEAATVPAAVPAAQQSPKPAAVAPLPAPKPPAPAGDAEFDANGNKRTPMGKFRKAVAKNLVQAQQTAAILTTFNEVDLTAVMSIRSKFKERFAEVHGVGLGFMSFFARAAVLALREFPRVNAMIEGDDIIYRNYVHLGIAVSTERGLVVPTLRNAHSMSFAKIESEIKRLANGARDNKLSLQDLGGASFTITNGGVFGSLLSTPILNPPQSGILGMHAIQKRPVAIADKVEIRPMMYVALSYDHRLVDGRESVSFLVRMKDCLEDPARMMLEI